MPGTILAAIGFAGFVLVLFIPETLGRGLPTSVQQIVSYPLSLTKEEKASLKSKRNALHLFARNKPSKKNVNKGIYLIINSIATAENSRLSRKQEVGNGQVDDGIEQSNGEVGNTEKNSDLEANTETTYI